MKFYHIDNSSKYLIQELDKDIKDGKTVFILFFMEGCGPCNATRPEWSKIKNVMSHDKNSHIVVADIDQTLIPEMDFKINVASFPTMKCISQGGQTIEAYEECTSVPVKDRTIDSFVKWIKSKERKSDSHSRSRSRSKSKKHSKITGGRGKHRRGRRMRKRRTCKRRKRI